MTLSVAGTIAYYSNLALKNSVDDPTGVMGEIQAIPFHLGANEINAEVSHQFSHILKIAGVSTKKLTLKPYLCLLTLTI